MVSLPASADESDGSNHALERHVSLQPYTVEVSRILPPAFFARPVLEVAPELLGKVLVRKRQGELSAHLITEVEAYDGPHDRACHAHRGQTPRNAVMFGPPGHFYVYFVYGMHWMLNMVTGEEGYPAAVLIRGIAEFDGPGKLTRGLRIDRSLNGKRIHPSSGLWVEDRGIAIPKESMKRTPRIGVAYAGACAGLPYRFVLENLASIPTSEILSTR